MADPVKHLNDECMLQILEFAGADCRGNSNGTGTGTGGGTGGRRRRRGNESSSSVVVEPDFFDTVKNANNINIEKRGGAAKGDDQEGETKIWSSVIQAARFYYPLALVNRGWKELMGRLLGQRDISLNLIDIEEGKEYQSMEWLKCHQLIIRSLNFGPMMETTRVPPSDFPFWLAECNINQLTTANIWICRWHTGVVPDHYLLTTVTLATHCPNLTNLRITALLGGAEEWDGNAGDFLGISPLLLSLKSIRSVDFIFAVSEVTRRGFLAGGRFPWNFQEMSLTNLIQGWTSLCNLRLECRQKYPFDSVILKIDSPSLERLSLERFSPWLETRFDLDGCPNLQEYTLGKARQRTKQYVVGGGSEQQRIDQNDPRCRRVSRLARRERRRRRQRRDHGRLVQALLPAPPLQNRLADSSSDESDGAPLPFLRPAAAAAAAAADSSSDENDGPPPLGLMDHRGRPSLVGGLGRGGGTAPFVNVAPLPGPRAAAAAAADSSSDESDAGEIPPLLDGPARPGRLRGRDASSISLEEIDDDAPPPALASHNISQVPSSSSDDSSSDGNGPPPLRGDNPFGDSSSSDNDTSSDSLEDSESDTNPGMVEPLAFRLRNLPL